MLISKRPCRGNVEVVLDQKDERGAKAQLLEDLELNAVLDRDVEHLSGQHLKCSGKTMSLQCSLCSQHKAD